MVRLVPMSEVDFREYRAVSVREYAQEHVKAGNWDQEHALQEAEKAFEQYLPQGVESKNQYLFSIEDGQTGEKVGMIWFAPRGEPASRAFIYDIRIYQEYQRRGYGTQTLKELEEKARELGLGTISLHVFGHNRAAIGLYEKAGYEVTDLAMSKRVHK